LLILLANVFAFLELTASNAVPCEVVSASGWRDHVKEAETCWMDKLTSIDSKEMTIAIDRDETIEGLSFWCNLKIKFLPIQVNEKFPNLLAYQASFCSVKEISKDHFKGLTKLKLLHLEGNQIEKVSTDTFEDLVALEGLDLSRKKLNFYMFQI
jgi:Leucine rich repeat